MQTRRLPVGPAARVFPGGPSGNRTRSSSSPRKRASGKHLQTFCCHKASDPGWSRTIALLVVTQASSPLDHGIVRLSSVSSPCGNRTRLSGLRGRDPIPIDERAMLSVRRAGVEPAQPEAADLQSVGLTDAQPTHGFRWRRRESNPQTRRFELRRFAGLRTAPCLSKAPSTGFEPAISCVTGRRALRAALRGPGCQ